jgi:cell division protein ZapA (FtsZ GTPase activity inhibitor)
MADLKPIGSERLQGQEKLNRILEIARYKENIPSNINETSRVEFERVLSDGNHYEIVKEKSGYVIKKKVNESLEYIEPMRNRKHYGSYSAALKRLNLIAGEVNRLTENEEEVSMYNLSEQKKFTLKTPKPAPMPEPMPEPMAAAPEAGSIDAPLDDTSLDAPEGGDEMDFDMDLDTPEGDLDVDMSDEEGPMGDEEEVTFKTIQKLTGKLGQKIRMMNDSVGMTSEDVKYVINSLLSALDLSKLDEEDQEDIMAKFEEDSESNYDSDMDMGSMGSMGDEEDIDVDIDDEEPIDGEMAEGDVIGVYSDIDKQRNEMSEEDKVNSHVSKMMDEIFAESKIDKVLTSYFQISESENKQKKQKLVETKKVAVNSIKRLSETIEQELAAEFIVRENSNYKLVGKTNKKNLVFEHNGEQIRVTTKGEVL